MIEATAEADADHWAEGTAGRTVDRRARSRSRRGCGPTRGVPDPERPAPGRLDRSEDSPLFTDDLRVDATETPIADFGGTHDLVASGYDDAMARYVNASEDDDLDAADE